MKSSRESTIAAREQIEETLAAHKALAHLPRLLGHLPIFKIEYFGQEHLRSDEPAVVIATHQNPFDAHVLSYSHLEATGIPLRLWAKKELLDLNLAGQALIKLGSIAIDRAHPSSNTNREALRKTRATLAAGGSVGIFAETKRTYGGIIAPLSTLGISLAKSTGVDIITAATFGETKSSPFAPRPVTTVYGSRTNPADIDNPAEFYRSQLQYDYDTALTIHYGRPLPERANY